MIANKAVLSYVLVWGLVVSSCVSKIAPTAQPEVTAASVQQQPTSTVFIGIPPIHDPLIQSENESVEEFVARIAARDISASRPLLIAFSQLENKDDLSFGVSSNKGDVQRCWYYQTDSIRECANDDLENYLNAKALHKIFFAFAHSNSEKALFLIEYTWDGDEYDIEDYYRLVLELENGKWIEKSILPYFW